ncbi:endonuclease domain-containing protein [Vibrio mediterranei]|uniref:Uncharacterized protein n=1 Tax=Vibrio mediterranei TaxID=689 RepID=A0ABX5DIZ7_9VIBR|nr:hypothetical protein COR52_03445 [Vibrio mediterranei]PRQ69704.1 hypothetical protein COR51_03750 [Vibrio mediterranei]
MDLTERLIQENPMAQELWGSDASMVVRARDSFPISSVCALCRKKLTGKKRHLDHRHSTGLIRGWLHPACNVHLGWYEKSGNWIFNSRSGVTKHRVEAYLMQSALKREQYLYESKLSLARRCWRVAQNATSKDEAKCNAMKRGLPWLWVWTLACQNGALIPWVEE